MTIKNKKRDKNTVKKKERTLLSEGTPRIVIDEHSDLVYVSPAFAEISSQSLQDLKNKELIDVLTFSEPGDTRHVHRFFGTQSEGKWIDVFQEGLHKITIKNTNKSYDFQFDKIKTRDGRTFIVAALIKETADGNEATQKRDRFLTDDMVKFVEALEVFAPARDQRISTTTDQNELRHFLNMSHDIMVISKRDGLFLRVNHTFNEVLGYTDEDIENMNFMDLVFADDRPHVRSLLQNIMRNETREGQIIDFEARIIARDGTIKWMEWRQKRRGKYIYSVGHNVTDVKKHEIALIEQQQKLSEAQAIGHMGHWHWRVGDDHIEWSDEIYRIFGVDKATFKPSLDNMNDMLHRRDLGRLLQAFQRAIIEQNNYDMDFRIIRPDGEICYVRCEGKCETDEKDEVTALFGIMQDITERMLYEREMREAKEAAERAYAAKTQFLANMSHELRTPLNAIIGFSEMMQRQLLGPIGTERYLDYIAGIRESGEHLLDLISDILDMSKIEAGKYVLDLEGFKVVKLLRLAVHMMEGRARDAGIKITFETDNDVLQIIADRRALMQIILNLLSNAVKFTEPDGSVRIECIEREEYLSLKIHDTGIGIPANKLKTITHPFEQAASHYTKRHEGTGLGLAITKDLVELHGGTLHIESTVGVGTTVTVRLPYDTAAYLKKLKNTSKEKKSFT